MGKKRTMKGLLFNGEVKDEVWKREWKNMPEFEMDDLAPFKSIIVHFEDKQDMDEFSKLIGQRITTKTKYVYYPKAEIEKLINKKYVDRYMKDEKKRIREEEIGTKSES